MKVNQSEARRRLARLYEREAAVYEQAASFNRVERRAVAFRPLAALYRRAAVEIVSCRLWPADQRSVNWRDVHELHKLAAA